MTCKGKNCNSNGKTPHSSECRFEYAANVASGVKGFTMPVRITDHIATLEFVRNHTSRTSEEIASLDAAIALMRGQSEPAVWQVRLLDVETGSVVHDWRNTNKQTYELAGGQPHQGTQLRCEYRALCVIPTPPEDPADEQ